MTSQQSLNSIVQILLEPAKESWKNEAETQAPLAASSLIDGIDWENFGPQAKLPSHSASSHTTFAAFSLIEALQWISLGAQIGALPRDGANALIKDHLNELKVSMVMIHATGLLNPDTASQVGKLIASAETPPEFKLSYPGFQGFPEAATVFIVWCSECCAFIQSDQARLFTLRLISNSEEAWAAMLSSMTDEMFEDEGVATISPIEGYLTTLQHLDRLGAMLSETDIPSDKWSPLAMMRVALGRLHGWRFSLEHAYYKTRFNYATEIVGRRLIREGDAFHLHLDAPTFFEAVDRIVRRYLQSIGFLISQAAS